MTKEEKRSQVAKVKAYDAAVEAMNGVAVKMAKEDMDNELDLSREQARVRAQGYMDSFKELLGERPDMPKSKITVNEELNNNNMKYVAIQDTNVGFIQWLGKGETVIEVYTEFVAEMKWAANMLNTRKKQWKIQR